MTAYNRASAAVAGLIFASVLSSTLLIPAVRPLLALQAPGNESAAHAFMSLNLLGGILGAPLLLRSCARALSPSRMVALFATLDALLLAALAVGGPLWLLLTVRTLQGAVNLAAIALLLGAAPARGPHGARYGVLGSMLMLGVACGAPVGTLLLRLGPRAPLFGGAVLEAAVALIVPFAGLSALAGERPTTRALPWVGMLWVFAERLAIGLFVVTFAFHARQCLARTDADVGLAISCFMLPFVAAVYPAGRACDRIGAGRVAVLGLTVYGVAWLCLADAGAAQVWILMPVLGLASSAVFAAAMRESGAAESTRARVAAMSALNSAGGLGMLIGTALAGILSAVLRAHGEAPHEAHALVFRIAGGFQLGASLVTLALLTLEQRLARSVRS